MSIMTSDLQKSQQEDPFPLGLQPLSPVCPLRREQVKGALRKPRSELKGRPRHPPPKKKKKQGSSLVARGPQERAPGRGS